MRPAREAECALAQVRGGPRRAEVRLRPRAGTAVLRQVVQGKIENG